MIFCFSFLFMPYLLFAIHFYVLRPDTSIQMWILARLALFIRHVEHRMEDSI